MVLKILPQREPFARRPVSKTLASLATTSVSALSSKPEARTLGPANIIRGAAYERLHSALEKYLRKNSLAVPTSSRVIAASARARWCLRSSKI